jgi:hypothetical protein
LLAELLLVLIALNATGETCSSRGSLRDADPAGVEKYLNALRRAQMEVDQHGELYKHYHLKAVPERYKADVGVRAPGERIVSFPYTGRSYRSIQEWIQHHRLFGPDKAVRPCEEVVLAASTAE